MPRIRTDTHTIPKVVAPQAEAAPAIRRTGSRPSGSSLLGRLGDLMRIRRSSSAQQNSPASNAPKAPVPPLPPAGFNVPARAALRPPSGNPRHQPIGADNTATAGTEAQHLGRQDTRTGVFVGTGKWNRADLSATAKPNRTEPLQAHEVQQAAYQLAARANGDPIEDRSDLDHLAAATATMHGTRLGLKHGRGNVIDDINASKGTSWVRSKVAYEMLLKHDSATGAGVALAYGAGICDHNAAINARQYAAMLSDPGETMVTVASADIPHRWSELDRPPRTQVVGTTQPRSRIVLDSWMDGPAVRLQDSRLAAYRSTTKVKESHTKQHSLQELAAVEQARNDASPGGRWHAQTESLRQHYTQNPVLPPSRFLFPSVPVIDAGFAHQARVTLEAQSAMTREVMAVAAGRHAYGLNIGEATKPSTIGTITHEAKNLHAPSRPPLVLPDGQTPSLPPLSLPKNRMP